MNSPKYRSFSPSPLDFIQYITATHQSMSQLVLPPQSEATTAESAFKSGCLLFDADNSPMNRSLAVGYFRLAADQGHSEAQFRYAQMLANDDGILLDGEFATFYFNLAASNGYQDKGPFMISPNGEVLFKNTTT
jgi:TPR repeat protein